MAAELTPIDVRQIPELARLVDEVRTTGKPRRIVRDDEDLAVLTPIPGKPRRRRRVLRADDPMFDLVGIGGSGGPGDVSTNKHHYLAEATRARRMGDPAP